MNVRISEGQLRFRITREEVIELLQGNMLAIKLPFSPIPYYHVRCESLSSPLTLREEGMGLTLMVDRSALEKLKQKLPSREGIVQEARLGGEDWLLGLEVDVRVSPH